MKSPSSYYENKNGVAISDYAEDQSLTNINFVYTKRLPNGSPVQMRLVRPEDSSLVKRMFARLSKETIYYRYFGYVPEVTPEFLARLTCVDQHREIVLIAETRILGRREIIGIANMVADTDGRKAEIAILIADEWQGQGLGSALTDLICEIAAEQGIEMLYANMMATNRRINALLQKKGFSIHRENYNTLYAERELQAKATQILNESCLECSLWG
ncbi:MAG: GNAT family N-acetyltransferase [Saprospiraceae bacterium]|nr:GNAT family N-acetyltransferase [Saprospiraceae bacterium]